MIESRSPADLVLALVGVINGDLPRPIAREILDPMVQIRMDSVEYCGINAWYKWIYLIRNCGRVSDLRITRCEASCHGKEPDLVHLTACWAGTIGPRRGPAESCRAAEASYLVRDGRIKQICTHKSNYEFIFGSWFRYSILYRLFLCWAALYFSILSLRQKDIVGRT